MTREFRNYSKLFVLFFVYVAWAPQAMAAEWHYLDQVTRVTVRGDWFYVQGTNPQGASCVDEASFYGTLNHDGSTEPGHEEYYSMALTAQTTGKGLACRVYSVRSNGVCKMENCYIR